jgi:hypothetical protein
MANALYPRFKEGLLLGELDMDTDAIEASLIDTADYTYVSTHDNYTTDVGSAAKVAATSGGLSTPTATGGVFDTADFTWTTVTGDQSEAIILWDDTVTTPVADALIAYYDTGMTGMPVTPNGGDINVTVHTSGWFAL